VVDNNAPELSTDQRRALFRLFADELRRACDTALARGAPPGEVAASLRERRRRLRSAVQAGVPQDVEHLARDADQLRVVGE
jgi:hypothetical protein